MTPSEELAIRESIVTLAMECCKQKGPEPWAKEAGWLIGPNDKPSWCGLFVRAIWRRAGLTFHDWRMGDANTWYLSPTERPHPGDLVFFRGRAGHQSIFLSVETDVAGRRWVHTIDGNTIGDGMSGIVAPRTRAVPRVLGYWRAPL